VTPPDGSRALGAPQIAGSFVNARGPAKKLGAARAGAAAADTDEGAPEIPSFGRVGYLSVTRDEIAIVRTKAGAFRTTITGVVLARVARSAIASVVFDAGTLLSHLTITFDNAIVWEFDIPRLNKGTVESVLRELDGAA
jgi:hypothetical protein